MARMTKSSWSSTKSRVLKALQVAKVSVLPSRRVAPLSEEWASIYTLLPDNAWKASLGRLISYCSDNGHSPDVVCDALIERFEVELKTRSLRGRPNDIVRGAIRGWNAAVRRIGFLPQLCPGARGPTPSGETGIRVASESWSSRAELVHHRRPQEDQPGMTDNL